MNVIFAAIFLFSTINARPQDFSLDNDNTIDSAPETTCKPGQLMIFCIYAETTYNTFFRYDEYIQNNQVFQTLLNIADVNKDNVLEFKELYDKFESYIYSVMQLFGLSRGYPDYDIDYYNGTRDTGKMDYNMLNELAKDLFSLVDMDRDDYITLYDFGLYGSFEDVMGLPVYALPAPVYKLYAALDTDLDERISRNETEQLARSIFSFLYGGGANTDCQFDTLDFKRVGQEINLQVDMFLRPPVALMKRYLGDKAAVYERLLEEQLMTKIEGAIVEKMWPATRETSEETLDDELVEEDLLVEEASTDGQVSALTEQPTEGLWAAAGQMVESIRGALPDTSVIESAVEEEVKESVQSLLEGYNNPYIPDTVEYVIREEMSSVGGLMEALNKILDHPRFTQQEPSECFSKY